MGDENTKEPLLPVGTVLHGTYHIVRPISSGGFANTYEAQNAFGDTVAVKEFFMKGIASRTEGTADVIISIQSNRTVFSEQKRKFVKKAHRLHHYTCPHLVRVHDLFEENGTAYYVMDYIDGKNLEEHLKATGRPMTEDEVLPLLRQVLEALRIVHGDGGNMLLHLDLKPANIMRDAAGKVVLIDFGASKQVSGSSVTTTPTAVTLTKGYAPREQIEQDIDKFGPWTDFYALGATLYKLLTNTSTMPMTGDIEEDDTPDKLTALPMPATVTPMMRRLIVWMMQPQRYARPQSVQQIEEYIETEKRKGIIQEIEINNTPPATDEDTQLQGATTIVPDGEETQVMEPHEEEAPQETPRKRKWLKPALLAVAVLAIVSAAYFFYIPTTGSDQNSTAVPVIDTDTATKYVEAVEIEVNGVPCLYYGTVDSKNRPHGGGKAVSHSGNDSDFRIYTGHFVHGLMDGDGEQEWNDGKKFVGTFKSNYFEAGTFTQHGGIYYKGTFRLVGKMATPWNGTWYDKNDKVLRTVSGGKSV